jgi:hypothetical protein
VLILIGTGILAFFITAFLVGATAFLLFGRSSSEGRNMKAAVFIFVIIAVCDIMYYPVFYILDLDIIIGNFEIANALGPTGLHDMLTFQLYDPVVWGIQTVAAYMIGKLVYRKIAKMRPEETPSV